MTRSTAALSVISSTIYGAFVTAGAVRHAAVAFLNIRSDAFMPAPDQLVHHVVAELAANTRHKKLHALTSAFALYISS